MKQNPLLGDEIIVVNKNYEIKIIKNRKIWKTDLTG